ncbi:DinB family protein [Actinocatenispora rupis]|uniref:DinB superfamily protein n=1 Tax=Actinocatenispora rupis TaxID=519421 RepID=A0A8J3NEM4_9ACTN|nr:DinB family protein [Actinocatenispora rupis]GID16236.1 hypothetical protein Aru02nite_71250 [Actinocatenispora rupis]
MADTDEAFVRPSTAVSDPGELLAGYLDGYRNALLRKVSDLSEAQLRQAVLPSGWTPLGLVTHLRHVDRRWLRWGFAGERIDDVWGDHDAGDPDGPWFVADTASAADVLREFREEAERCRRVIAGHALTERAVPGPRFDPDEPVPTLGWILCHLLQEYARHLGHLDVVRELTDGETGE